MGDESKRNTPGFDRLGVAARRRIRAVDAGEALRLGSRPGALLVDMAEESARPAVHFAGGRRARLDDVRPVESPAPAGPPT